LATSVLDFDIFTLVCSQLRARTRQTDRQTDGQTGETCNAAY